MNIRFRVEVAGTDKHAAQYLTFRSKEQGETFYGRKVTQFLANLGTNEQVTEFVAPSS